MRKIISVILMVGILMSLFGCGTGKDDAVDIQSDVDVRITVPKSEDNKYPVFIQIPFFRLYSLKDQYSDVLSIKSEFEIGTDVMLEGINTDVLRGATLSINQYDFKDVIDDNYYNVLTRYYGAYYLGLDEKSEVGEELLESVKSALKPHVGNTKVLSFLLSYYGGISEDVRIESLYVSELDLKFTFDNFAIETFEIPENVTFGDGTEFIDGSIVSGIQVGPSIEKNAGYACVTGEVLTDISNIALESLNNVCVIVDEKENERLKQEGYLYDFYKEQKLENLKKGENIDLEFGYILQENQDELLSKDTIVLSLETKIHDSNGDEYSIFKYQPYSVDSAYLMLKYLNAKEVGVNNIKRNGKE